MCGDGETIEKCEDEGYLTLAQSAKLSTLANAEDKLEILRSEEFVIFRSWLKGGRVIQDILDEKAEIKREKHLEKKRLNLLAKEEKVLEEKNRLEEEKCGDNFSSLMIGIGQTLMKTQLKWILNLLGLAKLKMPFL